jgi:hypothetical protein
MLLLDLSTSRGYAEGNGKDCQGVGKGDVFNQNQTDH